MRAGHNTDVSTEAPESPSGPINTYKVPPPGAGSSGVVPSWDLGPYYPGSETAVVPDANLESAGKDSNGTFTPYLDDPEVKTKEHDANTGASIAFTNTV